MSTATKDVKREELESKLEDFIKINHATDVHVEECNFLPSVGGMGVSP